MEEENEHNSKKKSKMTRNKISILLIGFYAGLCVISDLAVKYYFKDKKKVETANLTRILIIFKIPYLIKPLYGFLLDFFPIFGYKKKSYLFICFLVNISSWYLFIISNDKSMIFSIICLLFVNISLSFTTVIGSAIQVDLSKMYDNDKSIIGQKTSDLMSEYFIIKSLGTLIPSYFKGFLIEKYTNDIIFYISGLISLLIFISDLILVEDKIDNKKLKRKSSSSLIENDEENNEENKTEQILNLIKNKNIIILLSLIFILESSPFCASPLFYYETNILNLNPKDLGYIDFLSQISIIIVIYINKNLCMKYNFSFKAITFFVRMCQFALFSLIYMLIMRSTQKYIDDYYLVTITITLHEGFNSLGKLPYSLLAILFSPLNLEATTYSLCVFSSYLGNIFADYIDYFLATYFQISHYNFTNFGILVLVENILNLIPLFYTLAIPNRFFYKNKDNLPETSEKELLTLEDKSSEKKL